jgi:hypothetical protein
MSSLLAVTILGFTFSGTQALIVAIAVVIVIGVAWFLLRRRRRVCNSPRQRCDERHAMTHAVVV